MTNIRPSGDDCRRCTEIAWRKASGIPISGEDSDLLRSHVGLCPACATDTAIAALTADLGRPGPARSVDAAERERWIEAVLRREATEHRRRWATGAAAAAAVVAAALGVALVAMDYGKLPDRSPEPVRLFLVAGAVRTADGPARAGDEPAVGAPIEVERGRAGLRCCGGVDVFLDSSTRVRSRPDAPAGCTVELGFGRIVVDARGLARGTRFVVATPLGRIRVTGTVFAVETVERDVEVRVLDGSVEIVDDAPAVRRATALQAVRLSGGGPRLLPATEADNDRRLADWLVPQTAQAPVVLDVSSTAVDAAIAIDDRAVGPTPVTALVEPGAHVVEVRAPGRETIRDAIDIRAPGPFVRRYALAAQAIARAPDFAAAAPAPRIASGPDLSTSPAAPPPPAASTVNLPAIQQPDQAHTGTPRPVDAPPPPDPTPERLLDEARRRRADADWEGAAAAYEKLVARFPSTGEARVALVPLGTLRLEHLGNAVGALRAFETYLARASTGTLAEEASWGRIQALRALGRNVEAVEALRDFLEAFPDSLLAAQAHELLAKLEEAP